MPSNSNIEIDAEIEEIARVLTGQEINDDLEANLYAEYGLTFESLAKVTLKFMDMIHAGKSPITEKVYIGLADRKNNCFLVKREY